MTYNQTSIAPYSQDAEEAVLGAVLINPEAFFNVASFLKPDDFFILRHQYIWEGMFRLTERNEMLDLITVREELRQQGRLTEIGGPGYLTQLTVNVPTSIHAEVYGRLVERAAVRRRLLNAADEIRGLAMDETLTLDKVTSDAESKLFEVTERNMRRDLVPMREAISDYFDQLEHLMQHPDEPLGLPTGFRDLDTLLGGLQRSDLLIFAGRPGMGKTSFLLSVALNAAKLGARILIFTMEMGSEQIVQRLVSMETGINTQKLRLGQLSQQEWARFVQASGRLGALSIVIDDTPSMTPLQIRTKSRRMAHELGIDLIIIDYLQLMSAGVGYENNRVQEISYISRSLKELARELNVPVFSAAQLSRAVESRQDKRPQLSDLRESGCLTGDTLIYLPETGASKPIRALIGQTDFQVLSLNLKTLKLEPATVSNAFCTGTKSVYRLTTQLGREIRATANHPFLTIHGWKRLDELSQDDYIAVPRALSSSSKQSMSNAELALLGHLIGDGCTLPRHAIQYTTREYEIAEIVVTVALEVFNNAIKPRIDQEKGHNWYQVFLPSTEHLTHGKQSPVRVWLEAMNAFGLRSYEKRIPIKVFEQPEQAIGLFLRHLWSTDGCINVPVSTNEKAPYPKIYYATSSKGLACDVQSLLLKMGINARLTQVSQGTKGRNQFHVVVSGANEMGRFITHIGAVGSLRQGRLRRVTDYLISHQANPNKDIIPHNVWKMYAVPAMQTIGLTTRKMQAQLGNEYCGTGLYKQNVSRERALRLSGVVKCNQIYQLATSDIYWDEIVRIEPDGEEDVFDLTVPTHHNFVADNMIVHNSIEQDADIVIFLYRDVLYNEATDFPALAEVIVTKHRNGPTGTINLHFEKSLTKFSDARTQTIDLSSL